MGTLGGRCDAACPICGLGCELTMKVLLCGFIVTLPANPHESFGWAFLNTLPKAPVLSEPVLCEPNPVPKRGALHVSCSSSQYALA